MKETTDHRQENTDHLTRTTAQPHNCTTTRTHESTEAREAPSQAESEVEMLP